MTKCLYCGSNSIQRTKTVSDRLGVSEAKWSFGACLECGSLVLLEPPENTAPYYPLNYHLPFDGKGSYWFSLYRKLSMFNYRFRHKLLRKSLTNRTIKRALDIGCGPAYDLLQFQKQGIDVIGIDQDPHVCKNLSEHHNLAVFYGTLNDFKNESGKKFDLILANGIVEHVPDVESFFLRVRSLLRAGGMFFVGVPLLDSFQARLLGERWSAITEAPRHLSVPTQKGMRAIARKTGFELDSFWGDSALQGAGGIGLSIFPKSSRSHSSSSVENLVHRILAMFFFPLFIVFAWLENVFRRPEVGYFLFTYAEESEK